MANPDFFTTHDLSLWKSFTMGNPLAFQTIYEKYIPILTNYGRRICPERELVKDAIHDMFVEMWKNRSNLSATTSIKYYLIKALRRNLIKKITAYRKRMSENMDQLDANTFFEFSHELTLIHAELEQEKINTLHRELEKLSSRQKEVLFLRYFAGFSPGDIAHILGINQQSAYNLLHRSLETLKENMHYTAITPLLFLISKFI